MVEVVEVVETRREAKKVPAVKKTAPGKIVAANKVRGSAGGATKKAGRSPASSGPALSAPASSGPAAGPASVGPPSTAPPPAAKRMASARIVPSEKRRAAKRKWLPPAGDDCPPTHQVKAKLASMIYHLPGMASYVRTTPDRCYATAEDAEADGFARAKR